MNVLSAKNLVMSALVSACAIASANTIKIGILDTAEVLKSSSHMEKARTKLAAEFGPRDEALQKKVKSLQDAQAKLEKDAPVLSKAAAEKKRNELDELAREISSEQRVLQQEVYQKQQVAMEGIMNKLKSATASVASKGKIDIVLQKNEVVYPGKCEDLTEKVKKEVEKK